MKPVNITSYVQRPVDSNKEPVRSPITEWEYEEMHAGEPPRTLSSSNSSSDLYEFSISSSSGNEEDNDDYLSLCQPSKYAEPNLLDADPKQAGKALQGDLDFIASAHFRVEDRIKKQRDATNAALTTFKYTYFENTPSEEQKTKLPKLEANISEVSKPESSVKPNPSNLPKTTFQSDLLKARPSTMTFTATKTGTLNDKSSMNTSELLKSIELEEKRSLEISQNTTALRKKRSPKKKITSISQLEEESDNEIELLKSSSLTIHNAPKPIKKEICETTAQLRSERAPKKKEESSDEEYYIEKPPHNDTLQGEEFEISDDDILEQSFDESGTIGTNNFKTSELLKPVSSFESASISKNQYDRLNRSKNKDNESKNFKQSSTLKGTEQEKTSKSVKFESNPPQMFSKYMEEHPSPKKPDPETPSKFKFDIKPLANDPPSMFKNKPPKPPKKVAFEKSTSLGQYDPYEIADNPPSFMTETDRNKKKRKPVVFEKDPLKEFEENDDEEKIFAEHKRKKMIEERVNSQIPSQNNSKNPKSKDSPRNESKRKISPNQQEEEMKLKKEKEKKMFYDPAETHAMKLRNQRIRQKLALKHEQERILEEAEVERLKRQQDVALQLEPELRRLAKISKERQGKAKKFVGRSNDPKSVESIQNALKKVEETEVLVKRSDRSLILRDVMNKKVKEQRDKQRSDESRSLEKRKSTNEKLRKMWS